jgi:BMFP domain-containing protein YqiC
VVADFSDSELKELDLVAHEEFENCSDAGWAATRSAVVDHRQTVVLTDFTSPFG